MAEELKDFNIPTGVIQRIVRDTIVENINISEDAKTLLARAAAVFVLSVTSQSSQIAQRVNHNTLNREDIFEALHNLGYDDIIKSLEEKLSEDKESPKLGDPTAVLKQPIPGQGYGTEIDEEVKEDNEGIERSNEFDKKNKDTKEAKSIQMNKRVEDIKMPNDAIKRVFELTKEKGKIKEVLAVIQEENEETCAEENQEHVEREVKEEEKIEEESLETDETDKRLENLLE